MSKILFQCANSRLSIFTKTSVQNLYFFSKKTWFKKSGNLKELHVSSMAFKTFQTPGRFGVSDIKAHEVSSLGPVNSKVKFPEKKEFTVSDDEFLKIFLTERFLTGYSALNILHEIKEPGISFQLFLEHEKLRPGFQFCYNSLVEWKAFSTRSAHLLDYDYPVCVIEFFHHLYLTNSKVSYGSLNFFMGTATLSPAQAAIISLIYGNLPTIDFLVSSAHEFLIVEH